MTTSVVKHTPVVLPPPYQPAEKPTMYFIGVTTGKSSIMNVFPLWADFLGLKNVALKGINLALHDEPEKYRDVVSFIKNDPKSLGALVTSHKIDLYNAAYHLFDKMDDNALRMNELSSIYKENGLLTGAARDAISSGLAFERLVPRDYFTASSAELFIIGAGGSSIALSSYIIKQAAQGASHPKRIIVSNRSKPRLDEIQNIHRNLQREIGSSVKLEYHLTPEKEDNDRIVEKLPEGSIVVNGTGLGKDTPGSPLSDKVQFPKKCIAWDFNYRGDLRFLEQAKSQTVEQKCLVVDGWDYFIYGWTRVIADVFHIDIPTEGDDFEKISELAAEAKT